MNRSIATPEATEIPGVYIQYPQQRYKESDRYRNTDTGKQLLDAL